MAPLRLCTVEFMLGARRDVSSANDFFKKLMRDDQRRLPSTVGRDANASYPEAFAISVSERVLALDCKRRRVKSLNNVIGQGRRFIRRRRRATRCFRPSRTAGRTIEGIEAMQVMRKGQLKRSDGRGSTGQARFDESLLGAAA